MKKVKTVAIIIIVLLLLALAIHIGVKRHETTIDVIEQREAKLYAITTDNVPIFKDNIGDLWEIKELTDATVEDTILLEITNGETTRAWVEVNINGDEEIPES